MRENFYHVSLTQMSQTKSPLRWASGYEYLLKTGPL